MSTELNKSFEAPDDQNNIEEVGNSELDKDNVTDEKSEASDKAFLMNHSAILGSPMLISDLKRPQDADNDSDPNSDEFPSALPSLDDRQRSILFDDAAASSETHISNFSKINCSMWSFVENPNSSLPLSICSDSTRTNPLGESFDCDQASVNKD